MNRKLVSILVCTLLIATTLPVVGLMNIGRTIKTEPTDPEPRVTLVGYLSVPAAAYVPESGTINCYNYGSYLTGDGWFYAPVNLPDGAIVSKLSFYWDDISSSDAHLILLRYPMGGLEEFMADIYTSGSGGAGFGVDVTIDYPDINNVGYSYFLALSLSDIYSIYYNNALIEYTYTIPGSSGEDTTENEQIQENQVPLSR